MRTTPTLLLLVLPLLGQAQFPGDTLVMDFDDGATLVLDSVYPAGCWQVGAPTKPLFTAALSLPHALVTDTLLPFPENSTCYAEFTLITDESMGYYGRWVEFDHWLDVAPTTHAWLELADPWSGAWHHFGATGDDGWLYGNASWTAQGYEFDPAAAGWQHVIMDSPCIGVMDGGNDRWYDPIMRLRFVFASQGNPQGLDGWMIDNVRATATICTGSILEEGLNGMDLDPVPASDAVRLALRSPMAGDATLDLIAADGRVVLSERMRGTGPVMLDVSGLEPGYYVCRVYSNGAMRTSKLIIEH